MLLSDIWKQIKYLSDIDGTIDYLDIGVFNRMIGSEILPFTLDVIKEEQDNAPSSRRMTEYLGSSSTFAAASPSDNPLPANYLVYDKAVYVPSTGPSEPIDIIEIKEYYDRITNLIKPPLAVNYIAYIQSSTISFRPSKSTGNYVFFYTRKPVTPFLDYYMNTLFELIPMEAGTNMTSITTGEYRDGTDMYNKNGACLTVELDIPEQFHIRFMERIMDRMSFKDRDQIAMQYAMLKDQEDTARN